MIINTGMRTDIPAYYSEWFYNRIKAEFVMVRNPYNPKAVTRYQLSPDVVDCINFCTKNPEPMLSRLSELDSFRQIWHVTLTPYGKDIEPNVPDKTEVIKSIKSLSDLVGAKKVFWRYDPIFISEVYNIEYHIRAFNKIASELSGKINSCIISFIDLYEKTKKNFPECKELTEEEKLILGKEFSSIGKEFNFPIKSCCEGKELEQFGINSLGCMTKDVIQDALGISLNIPKKFIGARKECNCVLSNDIGTYNSCLHGCKYCYANYDNSIVLKNYKHHNPLSPFLIGENLQTDIIKDADQESFIDKQINFF